MIARLRSAIQKAALQRPHNIVERDIWAGRLICVFFLIGAPRLAFDLRFPFDTALLMSLSIGIALLFPFNQLLSDALNESKNHSSLRTDGRMAMLILLIFAVYWILILL